MCYKLSHHRGPFCTELYCQIQYSFNPESILAHSMDLWRQVYQFSVKALERPLVELSATTWAYATKGS